jgi:hypothetical protein
MLSTETTIQIVDGHDVYSFGISEDAASSSLMLVYSTLRKGVAFALRAKTWPNRDSIASSHCRVLQAFVVQIYFALPVASSWDQ